MPCSLSALISRYTVRMLMPNRSAICSPIKYFFDWRSVRMPNKRSIRFMLSVIRSFYAFSRFPNLRFAVCGKFQQLIRRSAKETCFILPENFHNPAVQLLLSVLLRGIRKPVEREHAVLDVLHFQVGFGLGNRRIVCQLVPQVGDVAFNKLVSLFGLPH